MRFPDVVDLNVHDEPDAFLRAMAQCESVASSSLHGLVFAEALGIPNVWIKAGDEIAGEDFKFRDWFATTARPQGAPHMLRESDTAADLVTMASLHDSKIDRRALLQAFPRNQTSIQAPVRKYRANQCRQRPTPVFIISFDRAAMVARCIDGIRRLSTPTDIIIHDNGSAQPETIALLDQLEREGVRVFRRGPIAQADDLNLVNETVTQYFSEWAEPARYVVTDCDIDVSTAAPNMLKVFDDLLNRFRRVQAVGPMLRIRDIPKDYPLYNRAINRHVEQFWRQDPRFVDTAYGEVAFQETSIDTTFALHRAGEPFHRLKAALRVYEPYEALHLDWYSNNDDHYTTSSNPNISHWNNAAERDAYSDAALEWPSFKAVRKRDDGRLEAYDVRLGEAT